MNPADSLRCNTCDNEFPPGYTYCPRCRRVEPQKSKVGSTVLGFGIVGVLLGAIVAAETGSVFLGFLVIAALGVGGGVIGAFLSSNKDWDAVQYDADRMMDPRATQPAPTVAAPSAPPLDFVRIAREQEALLLASGEYRKCPHCAEVIKAEASLCRFCQQRLEKT